MNTQDDPVVTELLAGVRDVHLPPVSALPSLAWWLLGLLLLVVCLAALGWRRRQRGLRWQRQARAELAQLRHGLGVQPAEELLAGCSALARRLMLVDEPRARVASIQGQLWLERLDAQVGEPLFSAGHGRLLLDRPYQRQPEVREPDLQGLFDAIERLIDATRPRRPGGLALRTAGGRA